MGHQPRAFLSVGLSVVNNETGQSTILIFVELCFILQIPD